MSGRNGDKSRFNRERRRKILRRKINRKLTGNDAARSRNDDRPLPPADRPM